MIPKRCSYFKRQIARAEQEEPADEPWALNPIIRQANLDALKELRKAQDEHDPPCGKCETCAEWIVKKENAP